MFAEQYKSGNVQMKESFGVPYPEVFTDAEMREIIYNQIIEVVISSRWP